MTVISFRQREADKTRLEDWDSAVHATNSFDVEANARHAANVTQNYIDTMKAIFSQTAAFNPHMDEKACMDELDDRLSDLPGQTFNCWFQDAERMRRGE